MGSSESLSSEFQDESAVPSFLWDRNITVGEFRGVLADDSNPRRISLLRVLLREARPDEVWWFVTPETVLREWDAIAPGLGRRRGFWEWLLSAWREHGFLH